MLASDLEDRLVCVDLLALHQELDVARGGVIKGQLQAVVDTGTIGNLQEKPLLIWLPTFSLVVVNLI